MPSSRRFRCLPPYPQYLAAANVVWNLGWPDERLAETAATLGSDVPFFFARRAALCRGRGEKIEPLVSSALLGAEPNEAQPEALSNGA